MFERQAFKSLFGLTFGVLHQVWKPLRGPVEESPLAMIDASTVAKEDLMDLRLEFESRTGYNYALKYNPGNLH